MFAPKLVTKALRWLVGITIPAAMSLMFGGAAVADWRDEAFAFHRAFLEEAMNPASPSRLKTICAGGLGKADEAQATLAGFDGHTVSIVVFSDRRIRDIRRAVWLKPRLLSDKERAKVFAQYPELTNDWAWVYDRNRDGLIDWFAFLIGALPVTPLDAKGLPDLNNEMTIREALILVENSKYRFWEIIDSNYDGEPDAMMVPANRKDEWLEGAMLLEGFTGNSGPTACCWRSDQGRDELRSCRTTAKGCETKDGELTALSEEFKSGLFQVVSGYFRFANGALSACRVPAGAIATAPRRR